MKRSFLRQVLTVLGTCALYLPIALTQSIPAQAATLTFVDNSCSSFTYDPPSGTLTCVVSGPPTCTVTGSNSAQTGTTLTLTASCSPAATSWAWTQDQTGTCSGTAITCQDNQASPITVNYKVTGSNGNGAGPQSPAFPVVWSNTVAVPGTCSISGIPGASQSAPYSYNLTVNCTTGGAATSWQWSNGSNATTQAISGTISTTTTFKVIASNATGPAPSTQGTITIGGGGGGGGSADCTNQGYPSTKNATFAWPADTKVYQIVPSAYGGMGPNDALVIQFTTPGGAGDGTTAGGLINAVEYGTAPSARSGSLSTTPCDFTTGIAEFHCSGTTSNFIANNGPNIGLTYNAGKSCKVELLPSTTYYLNIINTKGASSCAATGVCDMLIQLQKPSSAP